MEVGTHVWDRVETAQPNASRKPNVKWKRPYRVVELIRNGVPYLLTNVFMGQEIQRAAK